jgi:hypothetical protein
MSPIRPKCFFIALIAAWGAAIFLPSLIVAAAGLSRLAAGRSLSAATIEVADEVAPAAKIGSPSCSPSCSPLGGDGAESLRCPPTS